MIQITRRKQSTAAQSYLIRLGAILGALVCASLVMAVLGHNPIDVFLNIIVGSTGTAHRLRETINKAIPLAALSLGVAIAFKMKFWNIGAEGQFYIGAVFCAWVAYTFPTLPAPLLLSLMCGAAMIGGALWAMIPAILKARLKASEILVTLMLNYIAQKFISYLQYGPWKDPKASGFAKMPKFADGAVLPRLFGVHIGWVIVLVLAIVVYVLLSRTKYGYQIAVIGESETTAHYAGIPVTKIMVSAVMAGGAICGIAGFMQASGIERGLTDQLSGGLGFTAVITAWLAQLSAPIIIVVSILFAALLQGSAYIQTALQIPSSVADVLQGIILFFVLGSEFFLNYRLVWHKKSAIPSAKEAEKHA